MSTTMTQTNGAVALAEAPDEMERLRAKNTADAEVINGAARALNAANEEIAKLRHEMNAMEATIAEAISSARQRAFDELLAFARGHKIERGFGVDGIATYGKLMIALNHQEKGGGK